MLRGKVHRYGDNIDTDAIIPARYLNVSDGPSLAAHCFEDVDAAFIKAVQKGDIIVAGSNFGCGSSREHAPIALKAAGISCVIAVTFARIFYRNAINIGLPILECPAAAAALQTGDVAEVYLENGRIVDAGRGKEYKAEPFPPFMMEIVNAGGLIAKVRADVQAGRVRTRQG
jgi:3-isopropylmalate/(R)-2-methylmalate dehydratase small subunit